MAGAGSECLGCLVGCSGNCQGQREQRGRDRRDTEIAEIAEIAENSETDVISIVVSRIGCLPETPVER